MVSEQPMHVLTAALQQDSPRDQNPPCAVRSTAQRLWWCQDSPCLQWQLPSGRASNPPDQAHTIVLHSAVTRGPYQ